MPPPRPKEYSSGGSSARQTTNTPMSERQQMALLIQMTATSSSEVARNNPKKHDHKRTDIDADDSNCNEKELEACETTEEMTIDEPKKEIKNDSNIADANIPVKNSSKRSGVFENNRESCDDGDISDIEEENKKKRKTDCSSTNKTISIPKQQQRCEKPVKTAIVKSLPNCEKDDPERQCNEGDNQIDVNDEQKYHDLTNESLKVPPLKIVIPQQSCSIDTEGNVLRAGKISTTRNALPYVVSSNCEANDKDINIQADNSLGEMPPKTGIVSHIDEKIVKLGVEEKNLRVLRSSYRSGFGSADRTSNNSSPQMQSSSPSPSPSGNVVEGSEARPSTYSGSIPSPTLPGQQFDQENVNVPSPSASSTCSSKENPTASVDVHPRKRKIRSKNEETTTKSLSTNTINNEASNVTVVYNAHDSSFTNGIQMYLNIRKQIENKWSGLYPVKPRPPQGFSDYLLTKREYLLNSSIGCNAIVIPPLVPTSLKDVYVRQEKQRRCLSQRHIVEKEKLCLNVEQEILRVHAKAARNISGQTTPFSVCTFLKDDEVYNLITSEQEEKDKNARSRFNGRLLLSWLQDVDDKWEKIKESMILRHHNEAESLHAVQRMEWEIAAEKNNLYDWSNDYPSESDLVPIVHVDDDFDLLPA